MTIKYYSDGLTGIEINGKFFSYIDHCHKLIIPRKTLIRESVRKLLNIPCTIYVCDTFDKNEEPIIGIQLELYIDEDKELAIFVKDQQSRQTWFGQTPLDKYMLARKQVIENSRFCYLHDFHNRKYDIEISYSLNISIKPLKQIFEEIDRIYYSINEETVRLLQDPIITLETVNSERELTERILLPILKNKRYGYERVQYNHGPNEFGKDIVLKKRDEFGGLEYYGMQVKLGDVSGGTKGKINKIIDQVKQGFQIPFKDLNLKKEFNMNKFFVITSGKFTHGAQEYIVNEITEGSMKSNIIFLDGESIKEMMAKSKLF